MSYQVLARRLRPSSFDDVVGQPHVTTTLRNAIRLDRLPHALLLCGPRGVGKTSIARILARALNCDEGPTDKPCGRCPSCRDIAQSTSMDVQEIDAASHTGVENVREIRESVRFSAAPGKYRIFIIDEVHMLSQAAFNALLKTLEEPPARSLFVFATTDPQKIPATVLSRVQRFDLKRLGPTELLESLKQIAVSEGLEISESVLRALIREGQGSFRDVLTLLDRLVSGLGSQIGDAEATAILGLIDRNRVHAVLEPVLAGDPAGTLRALHAALEGGLEPQRLAAELLGELRDLLVARLVDEPGDLIDAPAEVTAELRERASAHSPESLQQRFRVLLSRMQDLPFAPRPQHALEVALIRLATLPSSDSMDRLLARLEALEGSGNGKPTPGGSAGSGGSISSAGQSRPERTRSRGQPTRGNRALQQEPGQHKVPPRAPAAVPAPDPEKRIAVDPPIEPEPRAATERVHSEPRPSLPDAPSPALESATDQAPESAPPPAPEPPTARHSVEEQRRLHHEAKTHPVVQQIIEILDAEISDIYLPGSPG